MKHFKTIIAILLALVCTGCAKKTSQTTEEIVEYEERSESDYLSFWWPRHDSINHAYVMAADPIWHCGDHGENIYDWSYQEKWYDECRKVLVNTYDSVFPGEIGDDKDIRMLDELIQFFETEPDYSTMGVVIANDIEENFVMYKLVAKSKALLTWRDKPIVLREINAWNVFHQLLNKFCLNMVYLGWYGGSGAGPACTAYCCYITRQRFKDVERLNQFYHNELPINRLIYTDPSNYQFEDAVDSVISERKLTPKAHEWYTDSEYEGYEKYYYESISRRDSLIEAYHNWVSAREALLSLNVGQSQRDTMIAVVINLVLTSGEK